MTRRTLGTMVLLAALAAAPARAQDAERVLADTDVGPGLVVRVGTTDGWLELALAAGGRRLVHGLALDALSVHQARKAIVDAEQYGLVSVERWRGTGRLPYAADLVNLIIADKAVLAARGVSDAETLRVIVPGGAAYLKDGGNWKTVRKPWPADIGDWTHFDYDCTNNAVSPDACVGPVTTLKWIDGYRSLRYRKAASGAVRSWRGTLVHEVKAVRLLGDGLRETLHLAVRDAFNGLGHWSIPIKSTNQNGHQSIVVADGRIFTMANPDDALGPMRAYDLGTGRELLRFDRGGLLETEKQAGGGGHAYESGAPRWVRILYHKGTLLQVANDSLYALDAKTGRRRWSYTDPDGHRLLYATCAPDLNRVYVAHTERAEGRMANDWGEWNSRWPSSKLVAISAFDADTGQPAWRNNDVAGKTAGQLVYDRGNLGFFAASGIGAMGYRRGIGKDWTWVGVLDAKTGKLKWARNYRRDPPETGGDILGFAFTLTLRDGKAYVASQNHLVAFDVETGKALAYLAPPIGNARCTRSRATRRFHLLGFGTFIYDDMVTTVNQNITRSDCMTGPTPANGMTYHTPNGCTCFAMIRGFGGYASDAPWQPVPVGRRLVKGEGDPPPALLGKVRPAAPVETFIDPRDSHSKKTPVRLRVPVFEGSPIRCAWLSNDVVPYPETAAVGCGDLQLVAVVNQHRLEARRGDRVVWTFVAGGRISTAPVVHDGKVYVGSHDGWVTCLDGADGRTLWRFMAAPNDRRIVAYGQLESSWPVYGVVLHDGAIAASAGRHPELDGGIYLYGLSPGTGRPRWHGRLHVDAEVVRGSRPEGKPRNWRRPANTIINAPLQVEDGKLVLVSPDATNEGEGRPVEHYRVVIDPGNPPT